METLKTCELCGQGAFTPILNQRDLAFNLPEPFFTVVRCKGCGLLFTNPRPSPEEISAYYPEVYHQRYYGDTLPPWINRPNNLRTRLKARQLERYYSHPPAPREFSGLGERILSGPLLPLLHHFTVVTGRDPSLIPFVGQGKILDVGCGNGCVLKVYQERGWQCFGLEPSEAGSKYAQETLGLNVRRGRLPGSGFADRSFDVVLFRHSLEHVHQPMENLLEAHRIMKDTGMLVVTVPNSGGLDAHLFRRWWRALDVPRHLFHFNPHTLGALLRKSGFRIDKISWDPTPFTFTESTVFIAKYFLGVPAPPKRLLDLVFKPLSMTLALFGMTGHMTILASKIAQTPRS